MASISKKPMQPAKSLRFCSHLVVLAVIAAYRSIAAPSALSSPAVEPGQPSAQAPAQAQTSLPVAGLKIGGERGELIGPAIDCDGDGLSDDSRIDFDGDGVPDECVEGREDFPEPPFEQTYRPTSEVFYSLLPPVGQRSHYQCGGDYEMTLSRPTADQLEYSADTLTLTRAIVYDDLDPNLNQPLIVQDPVEGIRYDFELSQAVDFYEYAIANYSGNVGLYIYQNGAQIFAAPCEPIPDAASASPATAPAANSQN